MSGRLSGGALGGKFLRRAVAEICGTNLDDPFRLLAVPVQALALPVWLARASNIRPLVPGEANPAEPVVDGLFVARPVALEICVVDAEYKLSSPAASEEQVV